MTIRMGLHRHSGQHDGAFRDYVDAVRPQFVKFLDSYPEDLAAFCHARGVRIIGRHYIQHQKLGAEGARQMREVVQKAREKPWVDYWELHNEDWQAGADMARYAELSVEFMRELEAIGRKAAIGCFSTGQPEVAEWRHFLPALRHAAAHGHAWAVHEYGGGPIGAKWGVGRNQWNGGALVTDDPCDDPNTRYLGWWCLRYRRAVDELRRLGLATIPDLLITEALIDDIQPRPGPQGKGYKDFRGQHPAHVGDYADQWVWYCRQLSLDPFVIGAVDFGWSTADPTWSSFDLATDPATLARVRVTQAALRSEQPAPIPVPPAPEPQPEEPAMPPIVPHASQHHSSRAGQRVAWVIVHSTASPANGTPAGTLAYLTSNSLQVSIHELINPEATYIMVHDDRAAHHAGYGTLPDAAANPANPNARTWGVEMYQTGASAPTSAIVERAAQRTAEACRRFGLGADRVLAHREIDPSRRSDPVGVNMTTFRQRVAEILRSGSGAPGLDRQALIAAGQAAQRIQLNPGAALQRALAADGFVPTSGEFDHADASGQYIGQRAEHLGTGAVRVYVVPVGRWSEVSWVEG